MVWSENFYFKPFPDSHAKRDKDRTQITPRTQIAVRLRLQIAPRSHAFDFVSEPKSQDRTPLTSLTSHTFDFVEIASRQHRSHRSHWDHNWEMVGFWWIWPDLMNYFLLGFVSVFIWEMVLYICLEVEKMWWTRRKYVFYIIFSNTTKH